MTNNGIDIEQNKRKLLGLEVIRFLAALSVLVWHYQHFFYIIDKPVNFETERQPFYSLLSIFYNFGSWGVQVFWCISGFIFFYKYRNLISEKIIDSKKFFILRFSRLYPLHVVTLILVALLQNIYFSKHGYYFVYQHNDFSQFFLQLFLASNWLNLKELEFSFNGPIWSISVEVLVYFFFFMTIRYIGKSVLIVLSVVTLCVAAKFLKLDSYFLQCVSLFYVGGLSAIAFQFFNNTQYKNLLNILSGMMLFLGLLVFYFTSANKHIYMFLLAYVPVLLYLSANNLNVNLKLQKLIEVAGNMTYSSYLIHFPIQLLIVIYFSYINQSIPYYSYELFSFFMISTLISSYFIYRYFEMPAQSYIREKFR